MPRLTTAVAHLLQPSDPAPTPTAPLAVQFWGTAGFRVHAAGTHVWLDPHFSRHSLRELVMGPIAPRENLVRASVDRADAVCVGHSHFDHALDAPVIARDHGARVYGSSDTLHWCRSYGVPEAQLLELVGAGETHDEGAVRIRAVRSEHSPLFLGKVPFPGRITGPLPWPAPMSAWRVGQVFGLHLTTPGGTLYHLGSAGLIDAELEGVTCDVALLCTIGRHATPRFVERALDLLRPKLVIPCHWDQFWRPLAEPRRQIPGNDLEGFMAQVRGHASRPEVRLLDVGGWWVA